MEEKKKSNVGLIIVIILLIVCVLGLGGYIVYDKVLSKPTPNTNTNTNTVNTDKPEEIDVKALGKEVADKFLNINDIEDQYFFVNNKSYSELHNTSKLRIAMSQAEGVKRNTVDNTCFDEGPKTGCVETTVPVENVKKAYTKLFGSSNKMVQETFLSMYLDECHFEGSNVNCYPISTGAENTYVAYARYSSASLKDNSLEVVVEFAIKDQIEEIWYQDKTVTKEISLDKSITATDVDEVLDAIGSKCGRYRLTFNKDTDGNWYWVSSSFIK